MPPKFPDARRDTNGFALEWYFLPIFPLLCEVGMLTLYHYILEVYNLSFSHRGS